MSLPRLTAGSRERIHHASSRDARGLPGDRRREELAQRVRARRGRGVAFRAELANRPDDIDRLLERAGSGALVVVDQKRNIGALVLARAHAHGNPCAYLPGYAEKQARGMFPGIAKTDAIDAEVIARTALGVPRALRPAPEEPEGTASLRILSSQREFASSARTRAKNRLRATLLEADPALEGAVDPSSRWC